MLDAHRRRIGVGAGELEPELHPHEIVSYEATELVQPLQLQLENMPFDASTTAERPPGASGRVDRSCGLDDQCNRALTRDARRVVAVERRDRIRTTGATASSGELNHR